MGRHMYATVDTDIAASTTKTLIQLLPAANNSIVITGWGITFRTTDTTDEPITVRLRRQNTAGTMSAYSETPYDLSRISDTFTTVVTTDATVEPGFNGDLPHRRINPLVGYELWYPEGREPQSDGGATPDRIGLTAISFGLAALTELSAFIAYIE